MKPGRTDTDFQICRSLKANRGGKQTVSLTNRIQNPVALFYIVVDGSFHYNLGQKLRITLGKYFADTHKERRWMVGGNKGESFDSSGERIGFLTLAAVTVESQEALLSLCISITQQ